MNIKATCNCGTTLEIEATSEAYAAEVFQDFLAAHPKCNHNASRPTADPITPGKNAELGETHKLRKELCNNILAELASQGFTTPEETYGADIGWAVADMSKALAEAMQHAKIQPTGWRMPKPGDKVRLVEVTDTTPLSLRGVQEISSLHLDYLDGCADVVFLELNGLKGVYPAYLFELVNETTAQEAK